MFEQFTDRARKVMALANQEAHRLNHEYLGTEHILAGLLREGAGAGVHVIKNLGIDLRKVRLEVERQTVRGTGQFSTFVRLPLAPTAEAAIKFAIKESRRLGHHYVGTGHLSLGLLHERKGAACRVLAYLGTELERACHDVQDLLVNIGLDVESPSTSPTVPALEEEPGAKLVQRLGRLLMAFEEALDRLLRMKDEAVMETRYEQAANLRDQAEEVRLAMQAILGEFEGLCRKAEQVREDLRKA